MKKFIWWLITATIGVSFPVSAEIQSIVLRWNPAFCLDVCAPNLERQLRMIPSVTSIQINPASGTAALGWQPNYPFNFEPINFATRSAGIRVLDTRLRVQGTITHDQTNIYLISQGDLTRFTLIGPIQPIPNSYLIRENLASHPITEALRQQLITAEATGQQALIEGPLFEPFRYIQTLVAEKIQFLAPQQPAVVPR